MAGVVAAEEMVLADHGEPMKSCVRPVCFGSPLLGYQGDPVVAGCAQLAVCRVDAKTTDVRRIGLPAVAGRAVRAGADWEHGDSNSGGRQRLVRSPVRAPRIALPFTIPKPCRISTLLGSLVMPCWT